MAIDKLNIPNKTDNAAKKKMVQSNTIGANETLLANEVNALVAKTNELVDATNNFTAITGFNFKENKSTYTELASIVDPQKDDAYGVLADGLIYIYNGTSWPTEGNGLDLKLRPTGNVAEGVQEAVSGGEVYDELSNFSKSSFFEKIATDNTTLYNTIDDLIVYDDVSPLYLYLSNKTATTIDVALLFFNESNVRTIYASMTYDFTIDKRQSFVYALVNRRGFIKFKKDALSILVNSNPDLNQRKNNKLSSLCYINNNNNLNRLSNGIMQPTFDKRFSVLDTAIKSIRISSVYNIQEAYFFRLSYGTNNLLKIAIKYKIDNAEYTIDRDVSSFPNYDFNANISDDKINVSITLDLTEIGNPLTFGTVGNDVNFDLLGIDKKNYYKSEILNAKKSVINICSTDYNLLDADYIGNDEEGINNFIQSLDFSKKTTLIFNGNFNVSKGILKPCNFNFNGYNATLRMRNDLLLNYEKCIQFDKTIIDSNGDVNQNNTFIKGFTLDGNMANNTTYNTLYGCGLSPEIFGNDLVNYSDVKYVTNLVLEDIKAKNFKRSGVVAGEGWAGKNIQVENSEKDHGFYAVGGGNIFFENITFKGYFERGALSIAGNNKLYQKFKSDNIIIRNVFFNECTGGPHIEVRGKFDNTLYPCNNVLIDGVKMINSTALGVIPISIGNINTIDPTPSNFEGFAKNIELRNIYIDINSANTLFNILRAQVKLSGTILLRKGRIDRPMFRIAGCGDAILNQINFSGLNIIFKNTLTNYPVFGLYNDTTTNLNINGFNINGMTVASPTNDFYLFDLNDKGSESNSFTVKNLTMNNVVANPLSVMNPSISEKIIFIDENKIN